MSLQLYLVLVLVALLLVYFIYERITFFQIFSKLGIPGPPPSFFTGNMIELSESGKLMTEVMSEWEQRYGLVYGYYRGKRATLVVRDSNLIKEVLLRNSSDFINRPQMVMSTPPLAHTVVGLRGQRWKEVRNILSPTFSSAKIKQMLPIMSSCVEHTVEILRDGSRDRRSVDAYRVFQGLACEVISACALAMKVNAQRDDKDKFYLAVRGFLDNALGPFVKIALCFPFIAKLMGWLLETFGYSHEMTKMIMESVKTAMAMRRKAAAAAAGHLLQQPAGPADALQLMMDATVSSNDGRKITALSDEEIVANAWVFILGGFETTSAALSYTCYLLSTHQDVQEELFRELKATFAIDDVPSYEQISDLSLLDEVICESLRLYPPVVSFVVRGMERDCQIGPYFVPKSVGIQVPVWQVHHDPTIWPNPERFDPGRFSNNAKKGYANNMEWIPFGSGLRNCIGARFALLNLKFTLSTILRKFKVAPSPQLSPGKLKLKIPSVTIVPDGGIPLRFIPRDD